MSFEGAQIGISGSKWLMTNCIVSARTQSGDIGMQEPLNFSRATESRIVSDGVIHGGGSGSANRVSARTRRGGEAFGDCKRGTATLIGRGWGTEEHLTNLNTDLIPRSNSRDIGWGTTGLTSIKITAPASRPAPRVLRLKRRLDAGVRRLGEHVDVVSC